MGKIIIKGYKRHSYVRSGERIPSTSVRPHYRKDLGAKGIGQRILPPLKKGKLGFSLKDKSQTEINKLALIKAREDGERQVAGRLRAIQILTRRTNPAISRKAEISSRYIYKNIGVYRGR